MNRKFIIAAFNISVAVSLLYVIAVTALDAPLILVFTCIILMVLNAASASYCILSAILFDPPRVRLETDADTPSDGVSYKPIAYKIADGDKITFSEWFGYYISSPFFNFKRRCKETPALRERCIRYAIKSGAKEQYDVERRAKANLAFITGNDK